jgi:hypothetical protein
MSVLRHKAPKGDHYNAQLTHALLKGNWADATAGAAPNGTALSWSELIRKWGKHTGGSKYTHMGSCTNLCQYREADL